MYHTTIITMSGNGIAGENSRNRKGWIFFLGITHYLVILRNILKRQHFPVYIRGVHKLNTHLCILLGCAVHHLACTAQPRGHTGLGQVFLFAYVRWWNIVQVKMLHQSYSFIISKKYYWTPLWLFKCPFARITILSSFWDRQDSKLMKLDWKQSCLGKNDPLFIGFSIG